MKLAFCFLIKDEVYHLDFWERFFENSDSNTWECYFHASEPDSVHQPFVKERMVKTVPNAWGDIYLAVKELSKKALCDNCSRLILLSESTIPTKSFAYLYDKLSQESRSWICYQPHIAKNAHHKGTLKMMMERFLNIGNKEPSIYFNLDITHWYYNETWCIYNSDHASLIVEDELIFNKFNCPKPLFANDENYPMYLISHYGLFNEVRNEKTTFVDWTRLSQNEDGKRSPHIYKELTANDIKSFSGENIFFARKMSKKLNLTDINLF